MATYLLAWNPNRWHWSDLTDVVEKVGRGEPVVRRWSCGRSRRIVRGDRVFLMRLGQQPRGIFGSGTVVVEPYEDIHWEPEKARIGKKTVFLKFRFDALLDPEQEPILWRERLKSEAPFSRVHWDTQISGIRIPDEIAIELEKVWSDLTGPAEFTLPEELSTTPTFAEGATKRILVNAHERDPRARKLCIEYHGTSCTACGLSLGDQYGATGEGLIHVHHLKPLAEIGEEYEVDPISDMRPVCPNCHAIIHRRRPAYSIYEIEQFLKDDGA